MAIRVVHGPNDQHFKEFEGKSVGTVRKCLREVFNIPPDATAFLEGEKIDDEYVLGGTATLEFVKVEGAKGLGALLTPDELCLQWRITRDGYQELLSIGLPSIQFHDGSLRHPECAVDEFFRHLGNPNRPKPPDLVGSTYIAERLGCTTVWVTEIVRRGEIPVSCVVPGTGNGKPWKFHRTRVDAWLRTR